LIRHNIGNRDAVIQAFIEDFLIRSKAQTEAMLAALPVTDRAVHLIEWLFDPEYVDADSVAIGGALLASADKHPGLADALSAWDEDFIDALTREFQAVADGDLASARTVAVGVAAIYANLEAMSTIDQGGRIRRESRRAAHRLAATLPGIESAV